MLDPAIVQQLQSVFGALEGKVTLVLRESEHDKQEELRTMLEDVAATAPKLELRLDSGASKAPAFWIEHEGNPTGISFTGIPGGHEFTSLILAILHADGKAKQPDPAMIHRMKSLQGPIKLRTFVSLSCENCPDVVQSLNLMASHHPGFEHEMVDGGYDQAEVDRLAIQGVPAVMDGDTLISSGRAGMSELLEKLEQHFGTDESAEAPEPRDLGRYDVSIIGGGPAGAAAAIYTARKGLKTLVISDRVGGQLQDTLGIENLISVTYTEGPKLTASLREHMDAYDIELLENRRVDQLEKGEQELKLVMSSGEHLQSRAVIVATGAKWRELNVEGEREYLGRGVAFCPHCDGPFYKDRDIAVIGGGNSGVEAAIDLAGIVSSVTVVEFMPNLKADAVLVEKLEALENARVIRNAKTLRVLGDGKKASGLELEDRATGEVTQVDVAGVFVQIGLQPNSAFLGGLVETNRYGEIVVDEKCRTNVPGVYAAGDVTTVPYKQIVVAFGEGAKAGLAAFEDQLLGS